MKDIPDGFDLIKVKFLPPNTTPLLQPLHQQVISNLEKIYMKALFFKCFEVTNDMQLSLRELWKDHFPEFPHPNWQSMDSSDMQNCEFCMENLWPDNVAERDFEGFKSDYSALVDEVVSMGKRKGLEVES